MGVYKKLENQMENRRGKRTWTLSTGMTTANITVLDPLYDDDISLALNWDLGSLTLLGSPIFLFAGT